MKSLEFTVSAERLSELAFNIKECKWTKRELEVFQQLSNKRVADFINWCPDPVTLEDVRKYFKDEVVAGQDLKKRQENGGRTSKPT